MLDDTSNLSASSPPNDIVTVSVESDWTVKLLTKTVFSWTDIWSRMSLMMGSAGSSTSTIVICISRTLDSSLLFVALILKGITLLVADSKSTGTSMMILLSSVK